MSVVYIPKGLVDRLFSMVVHDMMDGVLLFDMDGNCIRVNESAIEFLDEDFRLEPESAYEIWYQKEMNKHSDENGRDTVVKVNGKTLYLRIFFKRLLPYQDMPLALYCIGDVSLLNTPSFGFSMKMVRQSVRLLISRIAPRK